MITRVLLGLVGVLVTAYGALLLLTRQESRQVGEVAVWLAVGVVVHDVVLTVLLLLTGLIGRRFLAPAWRAPAAVALVVWGTLTIAAVPVLGRFGAKADNPTLLDRPYVASWLALLAVTVVAVVVAGVVRSRSARSPGAGG